MKRASTSAALNGSEGIYAKAGKRRSRLEDSVNSARETLMALRLGAAWPTSPPLSRKPHISPETSCNA